jgi:hypothetical protein
VRGWGVRGWGVRGWVVCEIFHNVVWHKVCTGRGMVVGYDCGMRYNAVYGTVGQVVTRARGRRGHGESRPYAV